MQDNLKRVDYDGIRETRRFLSKRRGTTPLTTKMATVTPPLAPPVSDSLPAVPHSLQAPDTLGSISENAIRFLTPHHLWCAIFANLITNPSEFAHHSSPVRGTLITSPRYPHHPPEVPSLPRLPVMQWKRNPSLRPVDRNC